MRPCELRHFRRKGRQDYTPFFFSLSLAGAVAVGGVSAVLPPAPAARVLAFAAAGTGTGSTAPSPSRSKMRHCSALVPVDAEYVAEMNLFGGFGGNYSPNRVNHIFQGSFWVRFCLFPQKTLDFLILFTRNGE